MAERARDVVVADRLELELGHAVRGLDPLDHAARQQVVAGVGGPQVVDRDVEIDVGVPEQAREQPLDRGARGLPRIGEVAGVHLHDRRGLLFSRFARGQEQAFGRNFS